MRADYVYLISDGAVVEHGTPEDLRNSDSDWVQQFVFGQADGPVPFQYPAPDYRDDLLTGQSGRRV